MDLAKCIAEQSHLQKIDKYLLEKRIDWIVWKNPPLVSLTSGVLEIRIGSTRNIVLSPMKTFGASLNEESLGSIFAEVEAITNSRPLS